MKVQTIHWEKVSQENPLTLMRRGQLQKLCREHGIAFDPAKTTARELRVKLKEKGVDGHENAAQ
jgi:hypothetical protein